MNRGNHRDDIFKEEEDYSIFLKLLEKVQKQYPFLLISYCLMTNHIHLQIETLATPLWQIMRNLLLNYTRYYNEKYNTIGHLFQGRYSCEIIENDAYMLQTSRYIHLNPVKARMVANPVEYPWSSYDVYMGKRKYDSLSTYKILDYFDDGSRQLYKEFVEKNRNVEEDMSKEVIKYEEEVDEWRLSAPDSI